MSCKYPCGLNTRGRSYNLKTVNDRRVQKATMKLMALNVKGASQRQKIGRILDFAKENRVDILVMLESHLTADKTLSAEGRWLREVGSPQVFPATVLDTCVRFTGLMKRGQDHS